MADPKQQLIDKYVGNLRKEFPWQRGEELVAAALGAYVENPDASSDSSDAMLICQTTQRTGAWRAKMWGKPRFLRSIQQLKEIQTDGDRRLLGLVFVDGSRVLAQLPDNEVFQQIVNGIAAVRVQAIQEDAAKAVCDACRQLPNSNVDRPLALLEQACAAEPFHAGPFLLKCRLLMQAGRGHEAGEALVEGTRRGLSTGAIIPLGFWAETPFSAAQLQFLCELLGLQTAPDQQDWPQLLFSAVVAARRLRWRDCLQFLDASLTKTTEPSHHTAILKFGRQLLSERPGIEREHDQATKYVSADNGALDEVLTKPIAAEALTSAMTDMSAFIELLNQTEYRSSNPLRGQHAWERLRAGNVSGASDVLGVAPSEFVRRLVDGARPADPRVWQGTLAAVEILLRSRQEKSAGECIESAYLAVAPYVTHTTDPLMKHASWLRGLIVSIVRKNLAQARLYWGLLANLDGFGWLRQWVVELCPQVMSRADLVGHEPVEMEKFSGWIRPLLARPQFSKSDQIQKALADFEQALGDGTLRVVIGGETGAGKSSFINRLIEVPVLYAAQIESTAVPTHIRFDDRWSVTAHFEGRRPSLKESFGNSANELSRLREFVKRHSFLGAAQSSDVARLEIAGPLSALPDDTELTDSPGLNAHALRTQKAMAILEESHACLFVIDARNALKAGEMRKISIAKESVGKTIFIVNKIDLVESDDDLDCDTDAVSSLMMRVQSELREALGVAEVHLFAVSSFSEHNGNSTAGSGFEEIRTRLTKVLGDSREQLLAHRARRLAREVSGHAMRLATDAMSNSESALGKLLRQVPEDPTTFRSYLVPRVVQAWLSLNSEYIETVGTALRSAIQRYNSRMERSLSGVSGLDGLVAVLKQHFRDHLNGLIRDAEQARNREWERVARTSVVGMVEFFKALYQDIEFDVQLDVDAILRLATPLPITGQLSSLMASIDQKVQAAVASAPVNMAGGALLGGAIFGPLGALIGGALGAVAAQETYNQKCNEIGQLIDAEANRCIQSLAESLQADLEPTADGLPRVLAGVLGYIDTERTRFEKQVTVRVFEIRKQLADVQSSADSWRSIATESSEWGHRFETVLSEPGV
ncbi:MAG: dynamin family protein [Planctomycetaceae bacterium]